MAVVADHQDVPLRPRRRDQFTQPPVGEPIGPIHHFGKASGIPSQAHEILGGNSPILPVMVLRGIRTLQVAAH